MSASLGGFVLNEAEGTLSEEKERGRSEKAAHFPFSIQTKTTTQFGQKTPEIGDADKVWRGLELRGLLGVKLGRVVCL